MIFVCERYPNLRIRHLAFQDGQLETTDPSDIALVKKSAYWDLEIRAIPTVDDEPSAQQTQEETHDLSGERITRHTVGRKQSARERREADKESDDAARQIDGGE